MAPADPGRKMTAASSAAAPRMISNLLRDNIVYSSSQSVGDLWGRRYACPFPRRRVKRPERPIRSAAPARSLASGSHLAQSEHVDGVVLDVGGGYDGKRWHT